MFFLVAVAFLVIGFLARGYIERYVETKVAQDVPVTTIETPSEKNLNAFGSEVLSFLGGLAEKHSRVEIVESRLADKLLLVLYPTSDETASYAVIDYGNGNIYKDLYGDMYIASQESPKSFLSKDALLIYVRNGIVGEDSDAIQKISIGDFKGKISKDVYFFKKGDQLHEISGDYFSIKNGTKYTSYRVNPVDFTLEQF